MIPVSVGVFLDILGVSIGYSERFRIFCTIFYLVLMFVFD